MCGLGLSAAGSGTGLLAPAGSAHRRPASSRPHSTRTAAHAPVHAVRAVPRIFYCARAEPVLARTRDAQQEQVLTWRWGMGLLRCGIGATAEHVVHCVVCPLQLEHNAVCRSTQATPHRHNMARGAGSPAAWREPSGIARGSLVSLSHAPGEWSSRSTRSKKSRHADWKSNKATGRPAGAAPRRAHLGVQSSWMPKSAEGWPSSSAPELFNRGI